MLIYFEQRFNIIFFAFRKNNETGLTRRGSRNLNSKVSEKNSLKTMASLEQTRNEEKNMSKPLVEKDSENNESNKPSENKPSNEGNNKPSESTKDLLKKRRRPIIQDDSEASLEKESNKRNQNKAAPLKTKETTKKTKIPEKAVTVISTNGDSNKNSQLIQGSSKVIVNKNAQNLEKNIQTNPQSVSHRNGSVAPSSQNEKANKKKTYSPSKSFPDSQQTENNFSNKISSNGNPINNENLSKGSRSSKLT